MADHLFVYWKYYLVCAGGVLSGMYDENRKGMADGVDRSAVFPFDRNTAVYFRNGDIGNR